MQAGGNTNVNCNPLDNLRSKLLRKLSPPQV